MSMNNRRLYKVIIELDKNLSITEEEIKTYIKNEAHREIFFNNGEEENIYVNEVEVLGLKDNQLELLWGVPQDEGGYEIEISLYYNLKDGQYGDYTYEEITLERYEEKL